jgi:hypothetical protein
MTLILGIPQLILLGLTVLSLGIHLAKHGEPKGTSWNFFHVAIADAIVLVLLYWGGFFG